MQTLNTKITSERAADIFWDLVQAKISKNSTIKTPQGMCQIAEDEQLLKIWRLVGLGQSIKYLQNFAAAVLTFNKEQLAEKRLFERSLLDKQVNLPKILLELAAKQQSGVLIGEHERGQKILALNAGQIISSASNIPEEWLGRALLESNLLNEQSCLKALSLMDEQQKPVAFALLKLALVEVDDLLTAQLKKIQARALEMFNWHTGTLSFYQALEVSELYDGLNISLSAWLRQAFTWLEGVSTEQLYALCADIMQATEPLELTYPQLALEFTPEEEQINKQLKLNLSASQLVDSWRSKGKTAMVEGLKALYFLGEIGYIRYKTGKFISLPTLLDIYQIGDIPSTREVFAPSLTSTSITPEPKEAPLQPTLSELEKYNLHNKLLTLGKQLLKNGRAKEALLKFKEILELEKDNPAIEILAYSGLAALLAGNHEEAKEYTLKASNLDKENALVNAVQAKLLELGPKKDAKKQEWHRKYALSLSKKNPLYFAEIQNVLLLTKGEPESHKKLKPLELNEDSGLTKIISLEEHPGYQKENLWFLLGVTFVLIFGLSNILALGKTALYYHLNNTFLYIKNGILLSTGIIYLMILKKHGFFYVLKNIGWKLPSKFFLLGGLAYGALLGYLSPKQYLPPPIMPNVIFLLVSLQVICEEIFFRAFISELCAKTFKRQYLAIWMSALLFGLYHLTHWSIWSYPDTLTKLYWLGLLTLLAGLPYTLLYRLSHSLTPSLVTHLTVNLVNIYLSLAA